MGVLVFAGKFKVIAGSGNSVVLGVTVGVDSGVKVDEGALVGLSETDPVTTAKSAAFTGRANNKINTSDNSTNIPI